MSFRTRTRWNVIACCWSALTAAHGAWEPLAAHAQTDVTRATAAETGVRVDEADITTRSHFARATEAAAAGQRDEAVDAVLRAVDADGDRLMPLSGDPRATWAADFTVYLPVRRFAQLQLAAMSTRDPELLRIYRRRVDPTARRWFDEADRSADLANFERVVDAFLLSSWGDDALWRASELALERGQFVTARRALERMHPGMRTPEFAPAAGQTGLDKAPAGRSWWLTLRAAGRLDEAAAQDSFDIESVDRPYGPSQWLAYPDGERKPADIEARAVLVSILSGERARATWELKRFRQRHPEAVGRLNGRDGFWRDLLAEWLTASDQWPSAPHLPDSPPDRATQPGRQGFVVAVEPTARPAWTSDLAPWLPASDVAPESAEGTNVGGARTRITRERRASLLASRPVVVDGRLVVQDAAGIKVLDARTGVAAFPGADESGRVFGASVPVEWGNGTAGRLFGAPRFELTRHDAHVWARVGRPSFGSDPPVGIDAQPSRIVELDLNAEGKVVRHVDLPSDAHSAGDVWAGPPIYHDGRLFAVLRRGDGIESQCHVVCYDAATGRTIWRRFVAAADAARPRRCVDWHNGILTLHEGRLIVDTQLGAIAAIAAHSGVMEWLTRYPRQSSERDQVDDDTRYRRRALTSCVVHDDLALVLAPDFPRPFALDVSTGQVVWVTSGPMAADAVHLIGVGAERLIVSGESLYWFDVGTGKSRGQYPAAGTSARGVTRPGPHGLGCGLLTGADVWWPTEDRILVFRQETALRATGDWGPTAVREIPLAPRGAAGGNLVLANGMLYIAGPDRLFAFDIGP